MHSLAPNTIRSDLVVKRTHVIVSHRITINKTQAQIFSWKAVALLAAKSRCSQTQGRFWSHFAARLLLKSVWMLQGGKRAFHSIKQMLCVRLHPTEAGGCKRELKNQKLLQMKKKKKKDVVRSSPTRKAHTKLMRACWLTLLEEKHVWQMEVMITLSQPNNKGIEMGRKNPRGQDLNKAWEEPSTKSCSLAHRWLFW